MTTLVIVESPGKVKKISAILGSRFKVVASVGHVRDLPTREMGIDPESFRPRYQPTDRGKEILSRLRKAVAAADRVLLATDPDREGEAIAWHLADALKLRNPERITFSAITKEKVLEAIGHVRGIDHDLVSAQEGRRVLDRVIGYRVSPFLSQVAGTTLSAGRVQSPAVRLVVDREREIQRFVSTTHYGVQLTFEDENGTLWTADWDVRPYLSDGQKYMIDLELAQRTALIRAVQIDQFKAGNAARAPAAPFITSSLQQEAGKKLKMKPKMVMDLAQKLYEQGAITYHRTDNPNLDKEGIDAVRRYADQQGWGLSAKLRTWKAKDGAQEGHEAIRPTHIEERDVGEDSHQRALYQLIWKRTVASQMADAIYAKRAVLLVASDGRTRFIGQGSKLIDPGWMALYGMDGDEEQKNPVPLLQPGERLQAIDGKVSTKKTEPPVRFKQSTLVAELEKQGIGRPSTYAAILENIITSRAYIVEDGKGYLSPSPAGFTVRDLLVGKFSFAELPFTKQLEERLDLIAEGKESFERTVADAWHLLDQELAVPVSAPLDLPQHKCPDCQKPLERRKGKKGYFWGCSGYPKCKIVMPDVKGAPGQPRPKPEPSQYPCPDCGAALIPRVGKKGRFWACSAFPRCKLTLPDNDGSPGQRMEKTASPLSDHACGKCGKPLVHRKGTGKKGEYDFWSCSGFPRCKQSYENANGKPDLVQ